VSSGIAAPPLPDSPQVRCLAVRRCYRNRQPRITMQVTECIFLPPGFRTTMQPFASH
jgi:hypothetical protein